MKKTWFISLLFMFCFFFSGCFFLVCDTDSADSLANTEFFITYEKDAYSVDEEFELTFSSVPDFSTFDKYAFTIELKAYDAKQNKYTLSDEFHFIGMNFEVPTNSVTFEYEKKDVGQAEKVVKKFSVKASKQGNYACYIHGWGYSFNDKGGYSALDYEKCLYIDITE
ncbi:hypothetical protein [Treponema zioleckii]|uniref:hypothetical protein n=1 Tax=Treponema zioleckii TaxID=331680 RepID=UPI00168BFB0E|nr:hypothetical protein [Treponema zioleckii]